MTFKRPYRAGLAALAVGLFAATAAYAEPTVNKGDNAWMLTSTVLVLLMTIPGLALLYFPLGSLVWSWSGPDASSDAVKARAAAGDAAAKTAAQAKLDEVNADAGWIFKKGAIDFAGGTVVHINSGIAGLVGALLVGKRVGYGKELMAPHSLTMSMLGASLLWVGWFGFHP